MTPAELTRRIYKVPYFLLLEISDTIERETGRDSIRTIEQKYEQGGPYVLGPYLCPWPGCKFKRYEARAMWIHVHVGPKHGRQDSREPIKEMIG